VPRLTAWMMGVAFAAGLLGPDALGVVVTALVAFVLAFVYGRAPWRWAILSLTAWATGAAVGAVLTLFERGHDFAAPSQSQAIAGVTVLAAYASAVAGAWLNWVASRLHREQ
jgi:hypothetical protein